jgi:glycosyltransferase involved in cell wall biosynthesis
MTTQDAPLVSVVTPAFDVAGYIAEAVVSVRAQDWPATEHLVVDDGSTDGTGAVVEALAREPSGVALRLVRRANGGAAAARNDGLAAARGRYVAFLDADDAWAPGLLGALARRLEADPALDLVFPRWRHVDAEGRPLGIESRPPARAVSVADLLVDNPLHSATGVMVRRSAIEAVGGFDEALEACIDLDCWVRIALARPGSVACVPEALALYRRRSGQITGDWRRMARNYERLHDKAAALAPGRVPSREEARARRGVYLSALAYAEGDHAASRRLILRAWRGAPLACAADPHARVRLLAAAASLLPGRVHAAIARRWNGARLAAARAGERASAK